MVARSVRVASQLTCGERQIPTSCKSASPASEVRVLLATGEHCRPERRHVARQGGACTEAREWEGGREGMCHAVHCRVTLDGALGLGMRRNSATNALACARDRAIIQPVIAVPISVGRPSVTIIRLPK